jgi:signal transduction histidine kinase/ligand-binding sensor domain-containing protein/CheY-like chemotaxis protein
MLRVSVLQRLKRGIFSRALLALALLPAARLRAQKLYIRNYTPEDGLAASQVFRIDQDDEGQMWFSTSEGVSRYDGVSFTNFTRASGMANQSTRVVLREPGGRVWIGTNSGVTAYDGRHLKNYDTRQGLGAGVVWCGTVDAQGRPWFGTQSGGVSVFSGGKFITYTAADGLPENYIYALLADRAGRLWIGTRHEGLAMAQIGPDGRLGPIRKFTAADGLPAKSVRALSEAAGGAVYLGTRDDGVYRYEDGKFAPLAAPGTVLARGADVYAMAVTRDGELAVGIVNGGVTLCALPDFTGCRTLTERNGLRTNQVLSLFSDREGCLWVGQGSGVSKLVTDKFENYFQADGLSHNVVQAVLPVSAHEIWLGTQGGMTRMTLDDRPYHGAQMLRFTEADGLPDDEVWAAVRDHAGRLWFGTRRGLCLYRPGKGCTVYTVREGLVSNYVVEIHEDPQGDLWVGTDEGLTRLNGDPDRGPLSATSWTLRDGLPGSQVFSLAEDDAGLLWIATSGGLSRFDGKKFQNFTSAQGLPVDTLNKLLRTRDGMLWAGSSGGGLIRIDPRAAPGTRGSFTVYDTRDGLPSNSVISLVEDRRGMLWLGTLAGAVEFDPREARPGGAPVQRLFDQHSGLASNEATSPNAAGIDPDGNLWFGLTWGVTRYLPLRDQPNPVAPRVAITQMRLNGRPWYTAPFTTVEPDDGAPESAPGSAPAAPGIVPVPSGVRELAFEFRGLSFKDESEVRYQTRLAGYEKEWSPETAVPFRVYTNLDPGRYAFEVRARNGNGVWNVTPGRLPLRVAPGLWQRVDVRVALLLTGVLALLLLMRLRTASVSRHALALEATVEARTRQIRDYSHALELHTEELARANARIRDADRMKSRFLASMSHELRTPLNAIIGFSEILVGRLPERVDARELKFLRNIQESGHHLLSLINNILDLSKIEAGKMEVHVDTVQIRDTIEGVRSIMAGMASRRSIEIVTHADLTLPPVRVDDPKVKQMLYNLIANAIKFSPDRSRIKVDARHVPAERSPLGVESFELAVRDQGIGIKPEDQALIFEEFRQAVDGAGQTRGGTGLGLAIVRKFAEIQGGTASVESVPGAGSTFRVLLPVAVRQTPVAASELPAAAPGGEAAREYLAAPLILVVEDDPETRQALVAALQMQGYRVAGAADGAAALELARDLRPALITLDLVLPGMDGWEVLKRLKADGELASTPVVIVSRVENRELGVALGADDYFLKPLDLGVFTAAIRKFTPPDGQQGAALLVIDDDPQVHELMRARLGDAGYEVVCAESGQVGLDLARTLQPAAVILDLMMPGVNGFEVAAALHQDARTASIPIVILTAMELTAADRAQLNGRISAILTKGEEGQTQLLSVIRELDKRRQQRLSR